MQEHVCARAGVAVCACRRDGGSRVCARAGVALRKCQHSSVCVPAWLCARAGSALHTHLHLSPTAHACAKGQRQHQLTILSFPHSPPHPSPSLPLPLLDGLTPFFPSSLLCQVRGCCHILCPTGPLVWAFQRCRPSSCLRCLVAGHSLLSQQGSRAGRRPTSGWAGRCRPVGRGPQGRACRPAALLLLGRPATARASAGNFTRNSHGHGSPNEGHIVNSKNRLHCQRLVTLASRSYRDSGRSGSVVSTK
jgi:hypothetical protein